jgi:hypothetical protein
VAVFELNIDAGSIFTNGSDAVAENGLDLVRDNIEDGFCEIASRQAKEKRFPRARRRISASNPLLVRPQ